MDYTLSHTFPFCVSCWLARELKLCVGRTADEGTEEYQRVSTNVGKGLTVIQDELHRMRMATKATVESLALQREVFNAVIIHVRH